MYSVTWLSVVGSACGSIVWNRVNVSGWRYTDTGLPTDAGLLCDITAAVPRNTLRSGPCRPCWTYVTYTTYLLTQCHWYRCAGWLHVGAKYTVVASLGLQRFHGTTVWTVLEFVNWTWAEFIVPEKRGVSLLVVRQDPCGRHAACNSAAKLSCGPRILNWNVVHWSSDF
jgi:hypothetical protein